MYKTPSLHEDSHLNKIQWLTSTVIYIRGQNQNLCFCSYSCLLHLNSQMCN